MSKPASTTQLTAAQLYKELGYVMTPLSCQSSTGKCRFAMSNQIRLSQVLTDKKRNYPKKKKNALRNQALNC